MSGLPYLRKLSLDYFKISVILSIRKHKSKVLETQYKNFFIPGFLCRERQPAAGFRLAGGEPAFVKIHLDSTEQRRARMETAPTDDRARGIYICASCNVEMWILQSTPIVHKRSPRVQGRPPSLSTALSSRSSQEVKSDLVVSLMFGVTDVPPSTSIASSARL